MRFLIFSVAVVWQLFSFIPCQAVCQEVKAGTERLHFSFPFPDGFKGRLELTASHAQRVRLDGTTDSILQLRGDVELVTVVCRATGSVCDKSPFVLQADSVDYNETTGDIKTKGTVRTAFVEPSPESKFTEGR